jgi:integrase
LWRSGLRIQEALALTEGDLDYRRGSLLVRRGKGRRRREVGMDAWGWEQLQPWLELRREFPIGPLLCVMNGMTRGRHWSPARHAPSYDVPPSQQACGAASRHTSSATPTPSKWPEKAYR